MDRLIAARRVNALRRAQSALFARSHTGAQPKSDRSVLHYRAPAARTFVTTYRRSIALGPFSVAPRRRFNRIRRVANVLKTLRGPTKKWKDNYRPTFTSRWSVPLRRLRTGQSALPRRFAEGQRKKSVRRYKRYFQSIAGRFAVRKLDLARAAAMRKRLRRQTPFETHRPNL